MRCREQKHMDELKTKIINALKMVYDPELPVNIYDLGLIYRIDINDQQEVAIEMTLTSPHCPEAQTLPGMVQTAALKVESVTQVAIELVWDPPWSKELMSEEARALLGLI
ncbi:MAG: DUF59 domain-containing protein [Gammaproteobacteria bacterium]|nr:DUF59 domain-containing protein [Gammaproteobacteria bacterium]